MLNIKYRNIYQCEQLHEKYKRLKLMCIDISVILAKIEYPTQSQSNPSHSTIDWSTPLTHRLTHPTHPQTSPPQPTTNIFTSVHHTLHEPLLTHYKLTHFNLYHKRPHPKPSQSAGLITTTTTTTASVYVFQPAIQWQTAFPPVCVPSPFFFPYLHCSGV